MNYSLEQNTFAKVEEQKEGTSKLLPTKRPYEYIAPI